MKQASMSTEAAQVFDRIVQERRAMRIYDQEAPFEHEAVRRSLERAVLAPNSSNMQLWEFYRVKSEEKKAALAEICMGQKSGKTARELVVFVCRGDKWRQRQQFMLGHLEKQFEGKTLGKAEKRALNYYKKLMPILYTNDWFGLFGVARKIGAFFQGLNKPMMRELSKSSVRVSVHKSCALAAQTFMLSMKAEGYDTCPMEGFDSKRAKQLLGLPRGAEICMIVATGPGTSQGIYSERLRVSHEEVIFVV